jgi:hypothetical protein
MKSIRYLRAWFCIAVIHSTLHANPLGSVVKRGQKIVSEQTLPLACLSFAIKPGAGDLGFFVLVNTDTNEEFVADFTSVFGPHPLKLVREEQPKRALSMVVFHLNAGRYRLKKVDFEGPDKACLFDLSTPPGIYLNIKPKCVNYVGTFLIRETVGSLPGYRETRLATNFSIEDTSSHDKAWAEKEIAGLALVESAVSPLEREKPANQQGMGFPVTKQTGLVVTPTIKYLEPLIDFPAEPGVFEAAFETEDGVYFSAPKGLHVGDTKQPIFKDGGIFLPKANADSALAGFYLGKPPATEVTSEPWRNLFMQEGLKWHLEQPTAPETKCPPNWQTIVNDWVLKLEEGKWRLKRCDEPTFRYSQPSGWLVPLLLERTDKVSSDEFNDICLLVVVADGNVRSKMLISRILDDGKVRLYEPLARTVWEPATK